MSSLDFELDGRLNDLESEWRRANEACTVARADYFTIARNPQANARVVQMARNSWERAELRNVRILAKMESLEDSWLGLD